MVITVRFFTPQNFFGPFPDEILEVEGTHNECQQKIMDKYRTFPRGTTMDFVEMK